MRRDAVLITLALSFATPDVVAEELPVALFRVEPLGLDAARAARLEALFRLELERLFGRPLPRRAEVERLVARDPSLEGCAGETSCLAELARKLGAARL